MAATAATEIQDQKFNSLGLQKLNINEEQVCTYSRGLGGVSEKNPVLVLIHGYPQSSYEWRHLIPLLPTSAPLYIPDLPGYGASTPISDNSKLAIGHTLLSALSTLIKRSTSHAPSSIPVVLIGHDRGARIAHHLVVTGSPGISILAVSILDIVPTLSQWQAASNPNEITGYFHWPFLANVEQARKMIAAYGGDRWCTDMVLRWAGKGKTVPTLTSDQSLEVYAGFFSKESVVVASCKDYEAGAGVDVDRERENQEKGRKIGVPVLVMYSETYLGSRYDMPKVWAEWVAQGVDVKYVAVGDESGHFLPEEAPEVTASEINGWLKGLGFKA
ncbi:alpha/beta-hydrolase [Polyplosphaeria fusca]|uniref:Alpha/beta-hydrolase n=1 Tax=Polyplosphaeria fusca TaxID=682080 RepID=A0A9P4QV36_9PLEO|nr:alpha/beta-hydrolase [Polyplosphaeria fusca]